MCYNATMSSLANVKVSNRGQMSLPASARRRWGFEDGGEVGVIDLDGALLLVPGGIQTAKRALHAAISDGRYEHVVAQIDDPDLAN
jgi:AbrB family looped-hinge helix DNA binding protein